jgi:hypothetical protein
LSNITSRGYAVVEFSFNDLAVDNKDRARTVGVYHLFGDTIDCGALMAWAWGVHRVIDALESVETVDAKKAVVTGHSRYGKAALIAGAFDERIAVTVPSHSGCAGASPYRFIFGKSEQLHNVVGSFPHWFRPDFNQFVDNVPRLPVDQHLLLALVAPRPLMNTEGTQDTWINPQGAQISHVAAKKSTISWKRATRSARATGRSAMCQAMTTCWTSLTTFFSRSRCRPILASSPIPSRKTRPRGTRRNELIAVS